MGSRLTGPIHQANVLAVILGIGLILGFSFYKTKSKYITLFTIVGQTILLLGIILTQSRLILGLTIISALIVSIKVINKDFFSNLTLYFKHKFTPIIVIAFIAITGISSYTLSINASFNRIFSFGLLETGVEYRIHLQEQGLKLLTVTPIYGWGTDSIIFVYNKYFELPKDIQSSYSEEGQNVDSTHNVFLDKFLELGIIGGSIYILLIATTLYHGAKNATTIEDKLILVTLVFFTVQSLLNVTMVEQEIINWILIFKVNTFEKHRP
jgi:O-antigen ligase